jgi:hypothetical protein
MTASTYVANGTNVILKFWNGDTEVAATCQDAPKAAELLNDARRLNDIKRQYTAAARKIATAEALPGFAWTEADVRAASANANDGPASHAKEDALQEAIVRATA